MEGLRTIRTCVQECRLNIDENQASTLSCEPSFFWRAIRESLEIQCLDTEPGSTNGMNRDLGRYVQSNTWKPVFRHWKNKQPRLRRWKNHCIENDVINAVNAQTPMQ